VLARGKSGRAGEASNDNGNQQTAGASKPPPSPFVTNVARLRTTEIPVKHGAATMLRRSGQVGNAFRKSTAGQDSATDK
jgi:hypothetical protein